MANEKVSLGDLLKEEPKESNKKVSLGDLLKEEPVKKKEFVQPSTDFSTATQFSPSTPTPTTTIPFKVGAEAGKPKVRINKENIAVRANKGESNPDIKELSELLKQPLPYQKANLADFNLNKPLPKIEQEDMDELLDRTKVVRGLRDKSIETQKALDNGIKNIEQQAKELVAQYNQNPSPELKSQIEVYSRCLRKEISSNFG
jgi:hypothetical protein